MPPGDERVPAKPFADWLNERFARYQAEHERSGNLAQYTPGAVVPLSPTQQLALDLGWGHSESAERKLYRCRNMLYTGSRGSVKGEYPTDNFLRTIVEDALDHAGVPLEDVYPDLAVDVDVEPEAYCATCHLDVTPVNGACPWCEGQTGERPPRSIDRRGQGRRLTDEQVRAAHRLHMEGGLSMRELGRRLYQRFGYSNAKSCGQALSTAFALLDLPARDRIEATRRASTIHGLAPRKPASDAEREARNALRREQKRRGRKRCPESTSNGNRCASFTAPGLETCRLHSPEGRAKAAAYLAEARKHQQMPPMLSAQMVREAVWLYTRTGMSAQEIARRIQPKTRSLSVAVVAREVRQALRDQGVYQGYKRPRAARGRYARHPLARAA